MEASKLGIRLLVEIIKMDIFIWSSINRERGINFIIEFFLIVSFFYDNTSVNNRI